MYFAYIDESGTPDQKDKHNSFYYCELRKKGKIKKIGKKSNPIMYSIISEDDRIPLKIEEDSKFIDSLLQLCITSRVRSSFNEIKR